MKVIKTADLNEFENDMDTFSLSLFPDMGDYQGALIDGKKSSFDNIIKRLLDYLEENEDEDGDSLLTLRHGDEGRCFPGLNDDKNDGPDTFVEVRINSDELSFEEICATARSIAEELSEKLPKDTPVSVTLNKAKHLFEDI